MVYHVILPASDFSGISLYLVFCLFLFQVGDVVLVQDESVTDNEFKMVGLETLVCFTVLYNSNL